MNEKDAGVGVRMRKTTLHLGLISEQGESLA